MFRKLLRYCAMISMFAGFYSEQAMTIEIPSYDFTMNTFVLNDKVHNDNVFVMLPNEESIANNWSIWQIESQNNSFSNETSNFDFEISELGASLPAKDSGPNEFHLGNAFPNPFNPTTTIPFTISEQSKVSLCIYSITGQKVRQLISTSMIAGSHSTIWNGRDDHGLLVSSGTYISRLVSGRFISTSKLTFVK